MINPLVSIVIPCYNQAEFLPVALDSVLRQTYTNWEIIVIDDGSQDNIDSIVNPFLTNSNITFLKKENEGLASARNFGIQNSSGELILPLDADDKIHTSYISKAISEFNQDENLILVYSRAFYFGELNEEWMAPNYDFKKLLTQNLIFCSAIFKRKAFDVAGGYREELKHGREDWDLWLRLLNETSKVVKIPDVLFYYRKHKNSSMSDKFSEEDFNNNILMDLYYLNKDVFMKYYGNPIALINQYEDLKNKYFSLNKTHKELNNSFYNRIVKKLKHIFKKQIT